MDEVKQAATESVKQAATESVKQAATEPCEVRVSVALNTASTSLF